MVFILHVGSKRNAYQGRVYSFWTKKQPQETDDQIWRKVNKQSEKLSELLVLLVWKNVPLRVNAKLRD